MNYPKTTICSIDGCDRPYYAKGLCRNHYEKLRCGTLDYPDEPKHYCTVDGCDRRAYAKDLCRQHYKQSREKILQMPDDCKGCIHRRPLYEHSQKTLCYYLHDTYEPRNCTVKNCNKYEGVS